MAFNHYLEGLASKAYSDAAATELATVPPYGTDREVCTLFPSRIVSNMYYRDTSMYSCPRTLLTGMYCFGTQQCLYHMVNLVVSQFELTHVQVC
jgi:hypothetical protein